MRVFDTKAGRKEEGRRLRLRCLCNQPIIRLYNSTKKSISSRLSRRIQGSTGSLGGPRPRVVVPGRGSGGGPLVGGEDEGDDVGEEFCTAWKVHGIHEKVIAVDIC